MIDIVIPSLPGYESTNRKILCSIKDTTQEGDVSVVIVEKEQSFAKNVNEGIRQSSNGVLVLNNDVILLTGWLSWITENPRVGIISLTPKPDCGWGFYIPREVIEDVGLLDENLENSFDDYDYFIRAALAGYSRILAPRHYAIHEGGHTINDVWGSMDNPSDIRIATCKKNMDYMKKKWPGIEVNQVPELHWSEHGVQIMREWKKTHGSQASS